MIDAHTGPQRCAVVVCHPIADSFCAAAADKAEAAAQALGLQTIRRDLYAMAFDPVLRATDLAVVEGGAPAADVETELALLGRPSAVILVYPVWFGSPPALLKGYVERVLGTGCGGPDHPRKSDSRLRPQLLITIASSAMTSDWLEKRGLGSAGPVFGKYLAEALGIDRAEHLALDGVIEGQSGDHAVAELDLVAQSVTRWLRDQHERWGTLPAFGDATPAVRA